LKGFGSVSQYLAVAGRLARNASRRQNFENRRHYLGKAHEDRHLMEKHAEELRLLVELDQRHDELLRELDELDKQVQAVLALWLAEREARLEAA